MNSDEKIEGFMTIDEFMKDGEPKKGYVIYEAIPNRANYQFYNIDMKAIVGMPFSEFMKLMGEKFAHHKITVPTNVNTDFSGMILPNLHINETGAGRVKLNDSFVKSIMYENILTCGLHAENATIPDGIYARKTSLKPLELYSSNAGMVDLVGSTGNLTLHDMSPNTMVNLRDARLATLSVKGMLPSQFMVNDSTKIRIIEAPADVYAALRASEIHGYVFYSSFNQGPHE